MDTLTVGLDMCVTCIVLLDILLYDNVYVGFEGRVAHVYELR